MSEYCIDCEIEIKKPTIADKFLGTTEGPIKYKKGWKCAECAKKRR